MQRIHENIIPLLDYIKIDSFYVVCHFKCNVTNKKIVSSVPFEPYSGAIKISWQEMLLHPIKSYNRYYHTPITIYADDCHDTIVLKAFKKVSSKFKWSVENGKYISV